MRKPSSLDRASDRAVELAKLSGEVEFNVARPRFLGARLFAAYANTEPHGPDASARGSARLKSGGSTRQ
jgi:hypothetical protein